MNKWCSFGMIFPPQFLYFLSSFPLMKINLKLSFVVKFESERPSPVSLGPKSLESLGALFFFQSWFIRWIPFCSGWLQQASYHQLTSSGGSSSSLITLQPISNQPGAHEGSSMVLAFVLLLFMSFQNSAPLGIPWPRGGEIASHSVRE